MERSDEAIVLTPSEAARKLLMSDSALRAWRRSGQGPRFIRLGRRAVRYALADLEAFIKQSAVSPRSSKPTRQGGPRRDRR